ncbi:helix-turn-helix transcriptional regulator [Campylobacter concisus]|uniref:S24 family peptidase n=1 Tax=Campylobacter concisus TaxID=199 RepID=UPI0039B74DDA
MAKAFFKVSPGKNLGSMEVDGESMTPILRSGDWVIFCEDGRVSGNGLYVVNFSDRLMVKILQLTLRDILKIVSVNPNFKATRSI